MGQILRGIPAGILERISKVISVIIFGKTVLEGFLEESIKKNVEKYLWKNPAKIYFWRFTIHTGPDLLAGIFPRRMPWNRFDQFSGEIFKTNLWMLGWRNLWNNSWRDSWRNESRKNSKRGPSGRILEETPEDSLEAWMEESLEDSLMGVLKQFRSILIIGDPGKMNS